MENNIHSYVAEENILLGQVIKSSSHKPDSFMSGQSQDVPTIPQ